MATPTKEVTVRRGDGARAEGQAAEQVAEQVRPMAAAGSLREAAQAAAEEYGSDEMEKQAQAIGEAWLAKLYQQSKEQAKNVKQAKEMLSQQGLEITDIVTPAGYAWWELLLGGPFQAQTPGGPFLPSKVIRAGEPAFFLAVIRRNPDPIPTLMISASTVMQAYDYTIRLQSIDLTHVADGPDFGPIVATFGAGIFGFLNLHVVPIVGVPAPPQGDPTLFETNMLVDISGPVPGLPFAGYNTWILDPDSDPGIPGTDFLLFDPNLGGFVSVPSLPNVFPGLRREAARWMVYTA